MLQTKILDEYPNYVIYSDGRIWSNTSEKFMSLAPNQDGYLGTVLTNKDGKRVSVKAHRLVALAFIPNPNGYLYVNHIDENHQNNNVENLEWCTAQYNELYGKHFQVLLAPPQSVNMLNPTTGEVLKTFATVSDAAKFLNRPGGHANIVKCYKGERKTAYGYRWEKN
jgi:hypothetical protein